MHGEYLRQDVITLTLFFFYKVRIRGECKLTYNQPKKLDLVKNIKRANYCSRESSLVKAEPEPVQLVKSVHTGHKQTESQDRSRRMNRFFLRV